MKNEEQEVAQIMSALDEIKSKHIDFCFTAIIITPSMSVQVKTDLSEDVFREFLLKLAAGDNVCK